VSNELLLNGYRVAVSGEEKNGNCYRWQLHGIEVVLNDTELFTIKWLHFCELHTNFEVILKVGVVVHAYNPNYFRGRDQEDHGSRPAWSISL
jgi:hypothetical protein